LRSTCKHHLYDPNTSSLPQTIMSLWCRDVREGIAESWAVIAMSREHPYHIEGISWGFRWSTC
jgi:hypothetical protein